MSRGILSFGAYVPMRRLQRKAIVSANAWFNSALRSQGKGERAMATPVLSSLPGAIDLVGALSLPEAAACLRRCDLFVANDSGLMHLAAAAGAATLGLFGPTPASEYGPSGRRADFVAAAAELVPMESLTLEAALDGARRLLDRG